MAEVNLTISDREGCSRQLSAPVGTKLMEVLRDSVDVNIGTCGGQISCGTCLVLLAPEWAARLAQPSEDEADMLDALGAESDSRLSCQIVLDGRLDGLTATIAPAA